MTKRQVNVRVSEGTRQKLDYLADRYGTQAEAVAVAIELLYSRDIDGGGGATVMLAGWQRDMAIAHLRSQSLLYPSLAEALDPIAAALEGDRQRGGG